MNLDELQKKLLAAARANPPRDHVPLAFERRVLAHLKAKPALDLAALWSRALWRASVPCLALALLLVGLSWFPAGKTPTGPAPVAAAVSGASPTEDLSTLFEQTLLASSDQLTAFDYLEENW